MKKIATAIRAAWRRFLADLVEPGPVYPLTYEEQEYLERADDYLAD